MSYKCPCGKRAKFNVPGQSFGVCCRSCKAKGMVDVVNKICPCGNRPKFNVAGEKIGVCCSKCKANEMINVGRRHEQNMPRIQWSVPR